MQARVNGTLIRLTVNDITGCRVDAIVNAANSGLMGGGGVDGAIHRAGGPSILAECRRIVAKSGSLPAGQAVVTGGGNLPARWVVHTVGPVWHGGGRGEDELLRDAYLNSLRLAVDHGARSVAFPSISTGAYRFPLEPASGIALAAVRDFPALDALDEVVFVLFHPGDLDVYRQTWPGVFPGVELVPGTGKTR